ncbi:unnamed protein product, partial [Symbiodinium sp. CCMP2456]
EPRGWSLKHGHRKRLVLQAEGANETSDEKGPGRSTVKRSLHNGSRRRYLDPTFYGKYGNDYKVQTRRNLLRREVVASLLDLEEMTEEWAWQAEEEAEWEEEDWFEELDSFSDISFSSCRTPSTTASSCDGPCKPEHSKASKRWDEAIGRANVMAKLYTKSTRSGAKAEPKSKEKKVPDKLSMLAGSLRNKHNVKLLEQSLLDGGQDSLRSFQLEFLEQFSPAICSGLRGIFRNEIMLRATPTNKCVYDRFKLQIKKKGNLCPVFHGTDEANLPSIYAKGLLVPGGEQGVRVAHGASHGNGIYTAKTQNPGLSFGFCRGTRRPLLVCGVLDDAVPLARKYQLGNHYVTAESQNARHVGDAIVVFDASRVIPLFEAWDPMDPGLHVPAAAVRAPALPPPAVQPQLPTSLPPAKVYKGGPKTRLRSKPETREAFQVDDLRRSFEEIRHTKYGKQSEVSMECWLRTSLSESVRSARCARVLMVIVEGRRKKVRVVPGTSGFVRGCARVLLVIVERRTGRGSEENLTGERKKVRVVPGTSGLVRRLGGEEFDGRASPNWHFCLLAELPFAKEDWAVGSEENLTGERLRTGISAYSQSCLLQRREKVREDWAAGSEENLTGERL